MSSKAMSFKAKIKNYAKRNSIAAQVVLQNYMFERFLERLSLSEYCDKFVIKGGMLVAAIVGLDTRSTMDLDTTLKNLNLSEENVLRAMKEICEVKTDDEVNFELIGASEIRKDDRYGGYCVRLNAIYDTIITPLSIDVSTGDVITPEPVLYEFGGIFDEEVRIRLWGYNIETVMAEKAETILSRGIFNTRPRDYYDIYILATTQKINKQVFIEALNATAKHRGSTSILVSVNSIIDVISANAELKKMWGKYRNTFTYAKDILFEDIINVLRNLF